MDLKQFGLLCQSFSIYSHIGQDVLALLIYKFVLQFVSLIKIAHERFNQFDSNRIISLLINRAGQLLINTKGEL
jgi:hypothetical protein